MGETNRHTAYDLRQMQSMSLDAKIVMTQERIRQWYEHFDGQVYVSFSGGKDSTVLKHIVDGSEKFLIERYSAIVDRENAILEAVRNSSDLQLKAKVVEILNSDAKMDGGSE